MGLAPRPEPFADSLRTPVVSTPVFIDNRIPLGLRDEYVAVGDHIAYFWETSGEFREAVGFLEVGLDRGEFCVIFGHTEGNRRVCESLAARGYDCAYWEGQGRLVIVSRADERRAHAVDDRSGFHGSGRTGSHIDPASREHWVGLPRVA